MAWKYGGDGSLTGADALFRSLGWVSLGLGVAELVAPGKIAKTFGLEGKENLLRAFGVREIGSGIATLSTDPRSGLMARSGGDLMDMAALAWGAKSSTGQARTNALVALGAVAGLAALDAFAANLAGKRGGERPPPADYSDRSGFPKGVEASRGYYRQKKTTGPAVAQHDVREDRRSSGEKAKEPIAG